MGNKINIPQWQWDEMRQIGTDYADTDEVGVYDKRMASFRDVDAENAGILDTLNLAAGAAVLEIGCGTGRFARYAASAGLTVYAADISEIMLEYLRCKVKEQGLPHIHTVHAGFLTMDFPPASFDAVVSVAALHHLPDLWKLVALRKIAHVLKPGGQFLLRDVVFTAADNQESQESFVKFIDSFGELIRPGAIGHVRQEYSTYDWIMEGLLKRAGFEIVHTGKVSEGFALYHCKKIS